jgi:hypothetical protein
MAARRTAPNDRTTRPPCGQCIAVRLPGNARAPAAVHRVGHDRDHRAPPGRAERTAQVTQAAGVVGFAGSRPSRLSVEIPAGTEFTVGNHLGLAAYALRVDPRADGAELDEGDARVEPAGDITSIEVPASLILSPRRPPASPPHRFRSSVETSANCGAPGSSRPPATMTDRRPCERSPAAPGPTSPPTTSTSSSSRPAVDSRRDLQLGGRAIVRADRAPNGGCGSVQTTNRIRIALVRRTPAPPTLQTTRPLSRTSVSSRSRGRRCCCARPTTTSATLTPSPSDGSGPAPSECFRPSECVRPTRPAANTRTDEAHADIDSGGRAT